MVRESLLLCFPLQPVGLPERALQSATPGRSPPGLRGHLFDSRTCTRSHPLVGLSFGSTAKRLVMDAERKEHRGAGAEAALPQGAGRPPTWRPSPSRRAPSWADRPCASSVLWPSARRSPRSPSRSRLARSTPHLTSLWTQADLRYPNIFAHFFTRHHRPFSRCGPNSSAESGLPGKTAGLFTRQSTRAMDSIQTSNDE